MKINLNNRTGVIELGSRHSMIMGNKPPALTPEMILETFKKESHIEQEKFGLFETATPNYTTYYPDVTADDLKPSDEDFIYPVFRALSATVVWKGYKPIDFSHGNVLKQAMGKLVGQTINADHETALGNAMGTVKSVFWQESTTKDGVTIPAGINAEFMIDGKSNPRIARGIMMNPPSIHSNSVSVRFAWKPSHQLKSDEDFFSKLGTKDSKGDLYRLVVTEILQFSETSLVSHGADAYAQQIGEDGKIVNPKYAAGVYDFSFSEDGKSINEENRFSHILDYKDPMSLGFNKDTRSGQPNNNNEENNLNMEKFLKQLAASLGIDETAITEENFSVKVSEVLTAKDTDHQAALDAANLKLTEASTEKTKLEGELATAKGFKLKADAFDLSVTKLKEDAKKNYNLLKGDNADDAILALIDASEENQLLALNKGYQEELAKSFPDTCQECGSKDISKASAKFEEEGEDNKDKNKGKLKARSTEDSHALILKKRKEAKNK